MPENNLQQQTDIDQAKAKLESIAGARDAQNDPRAAGTTLLPRTQRPADDADKGIRPVTAKPKKKRFSQRMKEALISEDIGNGSVSDFLFFKLLIPNVKKLLAEMANTAINMALGLDPKTRTIGGNTHTSNASLYRDRNYNRQNDMSYNRRNAISEYEWDEETAKDIFGQIQEVIANYGECSLMDAYSICGFGNQCRSTDRNWGWTSTRNMDVYPVDALRERWVVDLPSARPLN